MNQPAAMLERRFSGLVSKIEEGECVLVLGPRLLMPAAVAGGDAPIDDYLAGKLCEDLDDHPTPMTLQRAIAHHEREKSPSACRSLIQELNCELDQHTTELHRNIAALPFKLIVSATHDRMMANALRSAGKKNVKESYYDYCRGVSTDCELSLPTVDAPIVYSLFGRHDHPESMVLDDKNLLDYLVKITRETPALPDVVRATLRAPSTVFLFVGFGFTNWWLRLLLKVLEVTGVENRGISLALEDTSTFAAVASAENKGFFESAGIYIQARDWNVLARELAARIQPAATAQAAAAAAAEGGGDLGRPLVFLSYATEDADRVVSLRKELQNRNISVWLDRQNLRAGQNWEAQIARIIKSVDYFVFVQTEKMDERDQHRQVGVYNRELKMALERLKDLPYATEFLFHVTIGACRERPEPELSPLQRISIDVDDGASRLALAINKSYKEMRPLQALCSRLGD